MQLWYAATSPFARKVRIAARELGLDGRIELVETDPWTDERLRALNPLAKSPTLALRDGRVLYESGVICDYLDSLGEVRRLIPQTGDAHWRAVMLQALADGAATAAGRLFADENRPEAERSEAMLQRFRQALAAALADLERRFLEPDVLTIGEISVAALLGYLDFRWPQRDWRAGHLRLAAWFARAEARTSLQTTRHRLPGEAPASPAG